MVKLGLKYGLPFCSIKISFQGKELIINNVLLDTGSGSTVLKMDIVEEIGILINEEDSIETIEGIGGIEFVYKKYIDYLAIGELELHNFKVEIGVMDYGFDINGIIGMDFLGKVDAIIDLKNLRLLK